MKTQNIELEEFQLYDSGRELPEKVDQNKHQPLPYIPLTNPLNNIAICMSGGGFRASAFSLGTLAYLNKIKLDERPLLDNVTLISSVSGGSITAAFFALCKSKKEFSFLTFYTKLKDAMEAERLLIKALTTLTTNGKWNGEKTRNIINAFAKTYNEELLDNATFDSVYNQPLRVCLNATEFYRGLGFRFQNFGYMGNQYIKFKEGKLITGKLKLADMVAASSCFPAGFEPIEFPRDFANEYVTAVQLKEIIQATDYEGEDITNAIIPFMDGGITDNQGITSASIADLNVRRKEQNPKEHPPKEKTPVDLFLVTDVASYFMEPYKIPDSSTKGILKWRVNFLITFSWIVGGMIFATSLWTVLQATATWPRLIAAFLLFPSGLIVATFLLSLAQTIFSLLTGKKPTFQRLRKLLKLNPGFSGHIIRLLLKFLKGSRLGILKQMIKNRIGSVMLMINDINMKQVRRLIADLFYSNQLFENRRCSNYIYEYASYNQKSKAKQLANKKWPAEYKMLMTPSNSLMKTAELARTMPTTLWFDREDQPSDRLQTLITCGEFTTCGNLLEYLLDLKYGSPEFWNSLKEETRLKLNETYYALERDWKTFNK